MATLQELGTVRLQLRLGGEDYQKALHAVQGDTGRVIEWDILDRDSNVVTALPGVVPVLYVRRPDGSAVGSAQGTITGGVISIPVPSSLLAYAGEAEAQVQLIDSANQHKLHDEKYRLQIEESLEAGAAPGQNLWFSLADLNAAISTVQALEQQYDSDVAAVSTMRTEVQTNHDYVAGVYTQMSSVITSENARVTAENERKTAETARTSAETTRATAESTRVSQENTRKSSEVVRGQSEATRVSQESARVAAETARASAESGRTTAESGRVTAETARVTQYRQAQNLLDVLGENPNVQLAESLVALQKSAQPATHYVDAYAPIGVFVKTDITIGEKAYIEINVHTFDTNDRLQRYVLQHYFNPNNWRMGKLIALDGSKPIVANVYLIDDKTCFWIQYDAPWKTYYITAYGEVNPAKNRVTSITNEGKPTVYQSTHEISSIEPRPLATASSDGLYPKEHFAKVDAIPVSPKYTDTVTTVNGKTGAITKSDITALGIPAQDTVYTHPSTHPASMITQDTSRRMVSDTQIAAWDSKASGTHSHDSVQTAQGNTLKFSRLTQAAYNALGTKDPNTLYIIVG